MRISHGEDVSHAIDRRAERSDDTQAQEGNEKGDCVRRQPVNQEEKEERVSEEMDSDLTSHINCSPFSGRQQQKERKRMKRCIGI